MTQEVLSASGHQAHVPRQDSEANLAVRGKTMKPKLDFEVSAAHRRCRAILHMTCNSNLNQGRDQAV